MRAAFNALPIDGTVVIGEGERDEAPMLFIGEKVGTGGLAVDIALDPLEGTTLTAKAMANALAVMAMAEPGTHAACARHLYGQDRHRPRLSRTALIDLDAEPGDNINALAKAKGVEPHEITACVLDRPRHEELIAKIRKAGAAVQLITDGDVAGVIATTDPATGVDIYIGAGRRAGRRAGGGGAALRRRPDAGRGWCSATTTSRRRAAQIGHHGFQPQIRAARIWSRAMWCSPPPASPTARCCTACIATAITSPPKAW